MSTLAQLRRSVGARLNVLTDGVVSGLKADQTASAWYDASLAGEFKDTFRNAYVLVKTATNVSNIAQIRQVAGNSDGLLSFKRAWPAAAAAGDTYELYRRHTPEGIRKGLNWAIDNVFPYLFVRFQQEVAENSNTRDYPYPSLRSPAAPVGVRSGSGSGTPYLYRVASQNASGDAVPSPSSNLLNNTFPPDPTNNNALSWTAVSNTDAYLLLRSIDGGVTWKLLSSVAAQPVGSAMSFVDDGSYEAGAIAYTLVTTSPGLVDLRQLWRRANPGVLPAQYQELRGTLWNDNGAVVSVRYLPTLTDFICFVGYAKFRQLLVDTDSVDSARLPDELLICGAAKILYEEIAAGEASSSVQYYERQAKKWSDEYIQHRREFSMEQIGREQHPPEIHVVRGNFADLGPVKL